MALDEKLRDYQSQQDLSSGYQECLYIYIYIYIYIIADHQTVGEIFHARPKQWTNRQLKNAIHRATPWAWPKMG